jgi:hypothetical protein
MALSCQLKVNNPALPRRWCAQQPAAAPQRPHAEQILHRNLKIYAHEAKRSHLQEAVVASIWTLMMILMFAGSLFEQPIKRVETAEVAAPVGLSLH